MGMCPPLDREPGEGRDQGFPDPCSVPKFTQQRSVRAAGTQYTYAEHLSVTDSCGGTGAICVFLSLASGVKGAGITRRGREVARPSSGGTRGPGGTRCNRALSGRAASQNPVRETLSPPKEGRRAGLPNRLAPVPLGPMNNQARTPAPSSARTSTSVRASTPTRTPTPLRTPTPVRTRTPIRTLTPVLTPSPAGTPPLVLTPAPAQIPTLVPTPALARIPRLVPPPAPAWIPTPVPTPVPVRNPTPVPTPARTLTPPVRVPAPAPAQLLAGIRAALPVLDSYLAPALPLDPPPEPAPELPLLPEEDPEPAPSLKLIPSVSSEAGPAPGPLPTRTLLAANSPGPTLDFTFRADPSATGLADPPIPSPVPSPILGTIPSAISLQNSTETFPSSSENFALDKRVLIRVTYCTFY
ncbi:selenoprotein V isoform X4 [Pan paniscus]